MSGPQLSAEPDDRRVRPQPAFREDPPAALVPECRSGLYLPSGACRSESEIDWVTDAVRAARAGRA